MLTWCCLFLNLDKKILGLERFAPKDLVSHRYVRDRHVEYRYVGDKYCILRSDSKISREVYNQNIFQLWPFHLPEKTFTSGIKHLRFDSGLVKAMILKILHRFPFWRSTGINIKNKTIQENSQESTIFVLPL